MSNSSSFYVCLREQRYLRYTVFLFSSDASFALDYVPQHIGLSDYWHALARPYLL
jgi:hypothetical protein